MTLPVDHGVLVVLSLDGDDTWLRDVIRGTPNANRELPPELQCVIVETYDEAHRLVTQMSMAKHRAGKPYGGGWTRGVQWCR